MDRWRTGTLHDVLSQIRVDLKPNDYEAWRWHFEDTFGVEIDTVMKIAFAEHQNKMVKMEGIDAKYKKIDWWDNLKDWYRGAMTLQDDPCRMYYKVLMVHPILLVPPTKAITMTITTFFTESSEALWPGDQQVPTSPPQGPTGHPADPCAPHHRALHPGLSVQQRLGRHPARHIQTAACCWAQGHPRPV